METTIVIRGNENGYSVRFPDGDGVHAKTKTEARRAVVAWKKLRGWSKLLDGALRVDFEYDASTSPATFKREVEEYVGEPIERVESYPDPAVEDAFALRVTLAEGRTVEFLRHPDGELEDVEFAEWPPTSGNAKQAESARRADR